MGTIGTTCRVLGLIFLALAAVLVIRAVTFPSMQPEVTECKPLDTDFIQADGELKQRLKEAIRIQTITYNQYETELEQVSLLHKLLERSFPQIHSSPVVTKEVIGGHSLLYTVKGSDPAMAPYMLAAHQDVVPVKDQDWDYPPFEGQEVDGYIYGRGTIDDKHSLMGIMEALEFRFKLNQTPRRTLYLAFGHDEEGWGKKGAGEIARVLESRGIKFTFILDEGTVVIQDILKGIDIPIGMISVAEKGLLTLNLSVNSLATGHSSMPLPESNIGVLARAIDRISVAEKGMVTLNLTVEALHTGHSSMPLPESNIGILARAINRIEYQKQPILFGYGPERQMFEYLAPAITYPVKILVTNLWLFQSLVGWVLTKLGPSTNSISRTTTAITMVNGGIKANVLPPSAWAILNHRIHPSQTIEQVIDHDRKIINDDRVKITVVGATPPSFISPIGPDSFGYSVVSQSVQQVFSPVATCPGVMIGNTDTRFYWNLTDSIYRFSPTIAIGQADLERFHGVNERISVDNYEKAVNFFYHVMQNADQETLGSLHTHSDEL